MQERLHPFHQRIRELIRLRGGAPQVADFLGTSHQSVYQWADGSWPRPAMLRQIAQRLGVSYEELIGDEPVLEDRSAANAANLARYALIKSARAESTAPELAKQMRDEAVSVATGKKESLTWGTTVTLTPARTTSTKPLFEVLVEGKTVRVETIDADSRVVAIHYPDGSVIHNPEWADRTTDE